MFGSELGRDNEKPLSNPGLISVTGEGNAEKETTPVSPGGKLINA